jgi:hypothetical protein
LAFKPSYLDFEKQILVREVNYAWKLPSQKYVRSKTYGVFVHGCKNCSQEYGSGIKDSQE